MIGGTHVPGFWSVKGLNWTVCTLIVNDEVFRSGAIRVLVGVVIEGDIPLISVCVGRFDSFDEWGPAR